MSERGAPVLLAVADRPVRDEVARTLHEAGFEVWLAEDFDDALMKLHSSPRRLLVVVDPTMAPLLSFAASDRRLTHHHLYITMNTPDALHVKGLSDLYPCLTLWALALPNAHAVVGVAIAAAHLLDEEPVALGNLATRSRTNQEV